MLTLGCGPFFSTAGLWVSLVVLLLIKPATYFAFIQAFRYRVSRDIPMRFKQAALLTVARTVLGALILGGVALGGALLPSALGGSEYRMPALWVFLGLERLVLWLCLGIYAGLRTRRLVGWTISGVCIDLAYDASIGVSLADEWLIHAAILGGVFVFIFALHKIGRRDSLRARFNAKPHCAKCAYDLTGNLSGTCPECGTAIGAVGAVAAKAA